MELENFGSRSWKNAGPKFAVVMRQQRLELAQKHSTISTELHANNSEFTISICINKKRCFGKCWSKQISIDTQPLVQLILLRDAMPKQLKSLVCAISIRTLCFRPDLSNFRKEAKILDTCCNSETPGVTKNGLGHGVMPVALGLPINMLISSWGKDREMTVLYSRMKLQLTPMMVDSGSLSRISLDSSTKLRSIILQIISI